MTIIIANTFHNRRPCSPVMPAFAQSPPQTQQIPSRLQHMERQISQNACIMLRHQTASQIKPKASAKGSPRQIDKSP